MWEATHPEWRRAYAKAYYQAHKAEILAKQRARREAKKLAAAAPAKAVFRLALPLPDLVEFAHLVGSVPELRPDGLRATGP